ncbi:YkgJ family cysteine cluster protein [bacterium]|nr:YkgJ family cysteine cluster protein [bacterium]
MPEPCRTASPAFSPALLHLARRPVRRDCLRRTECCQFKRTGKTPQLTRGEALVAAHGFRSTGRKHLPEPQDGSCPFLLPQNQKCLIYESRPFGCRTHFCQPAGGPLERKDVLDLIRRLEQIDTELGGDGPHALPQAVAWALDQG